MSICEVECNRVAIVNNALIRTHFPGNQMQIRNHRFYRIFSPRFFLDSDVFVPVSYRFGHIWLGRRLRTSDARVGWPRESLSRVSRLI
jgi:hypothetical protein